MLILFVMHQTALGLFRMMAAFARDMVLANTYGSAALLVIFLLGGFILPKCECLSLINPGYIFFSVRDSFSIVVSFFFFQLKLNHGGCGVSGYPPYHIANVQCQSMNSPRPGG